MKNIQKELLGFSVPVIGVVETISEAITAVGSEAGVVNDLNNQVLAHSHFTVLRRIIIKKLVELSGVKQLGETVGEDEKAKFVVTEKDAAYVARLTDQLGEEVVKSFETEIAAACSKVEVDYKPGVRGSGEGRPPAKKWLAYYDQLVKEDKLGAFCAKHGIDVNQDEDDLKNVVAFKVAEIVTAQQQELARRALDV